MYAIELNGLHCGLAISFQDPKTSKLKVVVADHIKHTGNVVSLITRIERKKRGYWDTKYTQSTTSIPLNLEVHVHEDFTAEAIKQGATV